MSIRVGQPILSSAEYDPTGLSFLLSVVLIRPLKLIREVRTISLSLSEGRDVNLR